MKASATLIFLLFSFNMVLKSQSNENIKPRLYTNDFTSEITDGMVINCRKIKDIKAMVFFNDEMKKYDVFKIEVHRFGDDGDVMIAYKIFFPGSKEFQKKYANKEFLKLDLVKPDDTFTSDFQLNTLLFTVDKSIDHVICTMKEKQHCNFYLVIKGYYKTGKTDQFGEELYDDGKEISPRSIVFKNWEDKTTK